MKKRAKLYLPYGMSPRMPRFFRLKNALTVRAVRASCQYRSLALVRDSLIYGYNQNLNFRAPAACVGQLGVRLEVAPRYLRPAPYRPSGR